MVTGYRFIYIYIYISDGSLIALSLLDIARNWQTEDSMEFVQSSRKSNTTTAEMLERVQAESHVPDYWGRGRGGRNRSILSVNVPCGIFVCVGWLSTDASSPDITFPRIRTGHAFWLEGGGGV